MGVQISGAELVKHMIYADKVYSALKIDEEINDGIVVKIAEQKHDFYAALIKNKDGTYALSIRGTDSFYDFFVVDKAAFFHDYNIQYPIAKKFF